MPKWNLIFTFHLDNNMQFAQCIQLEQWQTTTPTTMLVKPHDFKRNTHTHFSRDATKAAKSTECMPQLLQTASLVLADSCFYFFPTVKIFTLELHIYRKKDSRILTYSVKTWLELHSCIWMSNDKIEHSFKNKIYKTTQRRYIFSSITHCIRLRLCLAVSD